MAESDHFKRSSACWKRHTSKVCYLIERAIDEARAASFFPPNLKQAPYFPGPSGPLDRS
jgi:hypothetical protein